MHAVVNPKIWHLSAQQQRLDDDSSRASVNMPELPGKGWESTALRSERVGEASLTLQYTLYE